MCNHVWSFGYTNNGEKKEYNRCVKCGLTIFPCNFCDYGNTGSRYGVFNMNYYGEGKVEIDSEHNDDDMWDINFCPLCGRQLKE